MSAVEPGSRRRLATAAILLFALGWARPYFPAINNPNENVRLYMTAAIVEEGRYAIDSMRARWGWVNDAAIHHGHVFSVKAPGTSLLGVPAYALYYGWCRLRDVPIDREVALWACRLAASMVPMVLFGLLLVRSLGRDATDPVARDAVAFGVLSGSAMYGYSLLFVSHATAGAAGFTAFHLLARARALGHASRWRAFAAGLCAAGVTAFEYPGLLVSVLLCVQALGSIRPWHRLLPFALGGAIPTAAVMHFQWVAFGDPLTPGHRFVETDAFRAIHHEGLYGATALRGEALFGLLLDPGYGLVPTSPLLVLAAPGFVLWMRRRGRRLEAMVAAACVLLTVLAIGSMTHWRGGWTVGPRYLVPVLPFAAWLALGALDAMCRRWRWLGHAIALGGLLAGLIASALPSVYYPHVPPEIARPLRDLIPILVAHDYAPWTVLHPFGVTGTAAMLPLFAGLVALVLWIGWRRRPSIAAHVRVAVGALGVSTAALAVQALPADCDRACRDAVAFVTRHWHPPGHDRASRLSRALEAAPEPDFDGYRRLAALYTAEGRDAEARMALQRMAIRARRASGESAESAR
ncbi:MAG: hypothetical protein NZ898_11065 [Myxococcota bacterium]|nr:hypothetical protein [Myxococcota bacterium]MDW8364096.1 hypothetical protein [Myxococcales bacterium]